MSVSLATYEYTLPTRHTRQWGLVVWLAGLAVVLSALHSWPLTGNRWWELLGSTNTAVIVGLLVWLGRELRDGRRQDLSTYLPHISICSFVLIAGLSVAVTPDIWRTLAFDAKLCLALIGGYALFKYAASMPIGRRHLHLWAVAAVSLAVMGCLGGRALHRGQAGFFDSTLKYGTYIGMLLSASCGYLMLSRRFLSQAFGVLLFICGTVSATSMGCLAAIAAGMAALLLVARGLRSRTAILVACLASGITLCLIWPTSFCSVLAADCRIQEADGINCRQRYIEWQAFMNLLGEHPSGAGAGCINTYRSMFYGRLPKMNTLTPFDENGWLATAAETGVVGLACFCWGYATYVAQAFGYGQRKDYDSYRSGAAVLAGLIAAGIANLFCSVQYNGLLIVFALLMALASPLALRDESHDRPATVA